MKKTKKVIVSDPGDEHENIYRNIYARYILEECSSPIDEIEYLFDNLPKDHKKEIINNMKEWKNE